MIIQRYFWSLGGGGCEQYGRPKQRFPKDNQVYHKAQEKPIQDSHQIPAVSRFMLFPQHKTLAPCSFAENTSALVN